jgi:hypothetical protein
LKNEEKDNLAKIIKDRIINGGWVWKR